MNINEIPVSVYFQLEDFGWDEVKDLPGVKEDELWEFEMLACKLVEEHFRKATHNIAALLEGTDFRSISIGIDVIGIGTGIASYYHDKSDAKEGNYGFHISYEVLEEYLKKHYDSAHDIKPLTDYTWEHELIHLLDHTGLTEFRYANRSTDVREFLVHYLLSFRNEGIADLYYFIINHNNKRDIKDARHVFNEDIGRLSSLEWENYELIKKLEWEMLQSYHFYSIGPWMILHILSCPGYRHSTPIAEETITRLGKGENIDKETLQELIKKALLISNKDFIKYISEPGFDGEVFINFSILQRLAARLQKIKHPRVIHKDDKEYTEVNKKLVSFFNFMLPVEIK